MMINFPNTNHLILYKNKKSRPAKEPPAYHGLL